MGGKHSAGKGSRYRRLDQKKWDDGYAAAFPQETPMQAGMSERVKDMIVAERSRQDKKWGQQNHPGLRWLAILMEEVGEVAQELLENPCQLEAEEELVQVAAVAVAWLEDMERKQEERDVAH